MLIAALAGRLLLAPAARAQPADVRPGDERPELPAFEQAAPDAARRPLLALPEVPSFEPPPRERGAILPPLELPSEPGTESLAAGAELTLRAVRIMGNTALSQEELGEVIEPYLGRAVDHSDVEELRDALTLAYVERGYVTSGAVVPAQRLEEGVLELWIVEGRVTQIEVETSGRLREGYVRQRLARAVGPPVDVNRLERALQVLQQDERIRSVHAQLVPGERRGEALLRVRVEQSQPFRVRLAGNNYSSPVIGGGRGELRASYLDVTGFGDALWAEYKAGAGLQDVRAHWEWPLTPWDTTLEAHFRRTWSEVVEAPFDDFDIRSETETYGFELEQPLYRSESTELAAFLLGEWRRSDSYLFGDPFSFVPGPHDGVAKLAVLRFGGSYTWRARNQVAALRTMISAGLPWLGATRNSERGVPDAEFVAWLAQLQWARRFPALGGLQLLARGDVQLADRPLFGLEQFAVGGHASVRGFRENRLVRDNGLLGSLELRLPVPLPSWREWSPRFEIAPFFDAGTSWNTDRGELGPETLLSIGVGGRLEVHESLRFEVYWGYDLKGIESPGDDLQDDGVSLGVVWSWP
jgi:hemolysin activation/secretion protein